MFRGSAMTTVARRISRAISSARQFARARVSAVSWKHPGAGSLAALASVGVAAYAVTSSSTALCQAPAGNNAAKSSDILSAKPESEVCVSSVESSRLAHVASIV